MKKARKARATKKTAPVAHARRTATAKPVPTFYRHSKGQRPAGGHPMGGELASAAQGANAVAGLRRFLKKYEPPEGEYQDGFHRSRVRAAQYELMRLEYIKGNVRAGDRLLARLQDLDR
jgi:hypothetical protein